MSSHPLGYSLDVSNPNPAARSLWQHLLVWDLPKVALVTLTWMAFFNLASLDISKEEVGLDAQVLAKLAGIAIAGLLGAWGWLTQSRVRRLCSTDWMLGISAFLVLYFIAALTGYNRIASTISVICLLATVLLTSFSIVASGWYRTFHAAALGVLLYCIASLLFWAVAPEAAMFAEPLPEGEFAMRLRGLSHPNTLGQYSGLTLAVSVVLWIDRRINTWLAGTVVLLAIVCLAGSFSRASILASGLSLAFAFRSRLPVTRAIVPLLLLTSLICFSGVLFSGAVDFDSQIDLLVQKLSKSGEAEELTSATGRADIWAKTVELIAQRPLLGYGANTSKDLLIDYSQYTHNLFLNTALSGGVLCLVITVWIALGRLLQALRQPNVYADLILAFILVNGLVENVIYAPIPAAMTIFWILALTSESHVVRARSQREIPALN